MGQTRRLLIRLGAAGWISSVSGFSASAQVSPVAVDLSRRIDAVQPAARDITGTWEGTFKLDSAWRLPERAAASSVPARLHFNPVGDASPTTSSPRSVHPGTFEIDFSRFGFTLSTQEALGWSVTDDSLRAVLNPTVDHGLVEVHGAFRGETVVGTWRYTSDPGGATGTFEIRRTSAR
jgi:hypothetical protein